MSSHLVQPVPVPRVSALGSIYSSATADRTGLAHHKKETRQAEMNRGTLALSLQRMNGNDRRDNFRKHEDAEGTQTTDQPAGLCIIGFGSIGWTPEREREEVGGIRSVELPQGVS